MLHEEGVQVHAVVFDGASKNVVMAEKLGCNIEKCELVGSFEVVEDTILTQNPESNVASENSRDALNLTIISEALEACKRKSNAQNVENVVSYV